MKLEDLWDRDDLNREFFDLPPDFYKAMIRREKICNRFYELGIWSKEKRDEELFKWFGLNITKEKENEKQSDKETEE